MYSWEGAIETKCLSAKAKCELYALEGQLDFHITSRGRGY